MSEYSVLTKRQKLITISYIIGIIASVASTIWIVIQVTDLIQQRLSNSTSYTSEAVILSSNNSTDAELTEPYEKSAPSTPELMFQQLGKATVYYYANGGFNAPEIFVVQKDSYGLIIFNHPIDIPTKRGYRFVGWLFENDNDNFCFDKPGDIIKFDTERPNSHSILKYHAQWERDWH